MASACYRVEGKIFNFVFAYLEATDDKPLCLEYLFTVISYLKQISYILLLSSIHRHILLKNVFLPDFVSIIVLSSVIGCVCAFHSQSFPHIQNTLTMISIVCQICITIICWNINIQSNWNTEIQLLWLIVLAIQEYVSLGLTQKNSDLSIEHVW